MNSKRYDPEEAEKLANNPALSMEEKLFRTEDGEFFLEFSDTWIDERRLAEDEDMGAILTEERIEMPSNRVRYTTRITPLTSRAALEWCIKTQIPETFRGYVLDCLPPS